MSILLAYIAQVRIALIHLWRRIDEPSQTGASPERDLGVFGDCFLHGVLVQSIAARGERSGEATLNR